MKSSIGIFLLIIVYSFLYAQNEEFIELSYKKSQKKEFATDFNTQIMNKTIPFVRHQVQKSNVVHITKIGNEIIDKRLERLFVSDQKYYLKSYDSIFNSSRYEEKDNGSLYRVDDDYLKNCIDSNKLLDKIDLKLKSFLSQFEVYDNERAKDFLLIQSLCESIINDNEQNAERLESLKKLVISNNTIIKETSSIPDSLKIIIDGYNKQLCNLIDDSFKEVNDKLDILMWGIGIFIVILFIFMIKKSTNHKYKSIPLKDALFFHKKETNIYFLNEIRAKKFYTYENSHPIIIGKDEANLINVQIASYHKELFIYWENNSFYFEKVNNSQLKKFDYPIVDSREAFALRSMIQDDSFLIKKMDNETIIQFYLLNKKNYSKNLFINRNQVMYNKDEFEPQQRIIIEENNNVNVR